MRTIQVSTDVFAAVWRSRQEGENTEDQILRRVFHIKTLAPGPLSNGKPQGFQDLRNGASFDEGEEIFRVYKGTEYRARAEGGAWTLLNTGKRYLSVKELSDATVGHENAWTGWFYLDAKGRRRPVSDRRDSSKIHRRSSLIDLA